MQKCKDIIEFKNVYDFKWVVCKIITVDSGIEYRSRVEDLKDIIELSEFEMK